MTHVLDHRVRPSSGEPAGGLVLLHGRGADEHDLFDLLDLFDPKRRLLGITPGAPLRLPPGGRHWYRLGGLPTPEPESFRASVELLSTFLEELPIPLDRIVLGGFSQGCVMTWALTLGPERPQPAAVIGMSGFLPRVDGWQLDPARLRGVPVAIAHGSADPVIDVAFGREARAALEAAGVEPAWLETPYPHGVDAAWVEPIRALVEHATPS